MIPKSLWLLPTVLALAATAKDCESRDHPWATRPSKATAKAATKWVDVEPGRIGVIDDQDQVSYARACELLTEKAVVEFSDVDLGNWRLPRDEAGREPMVRPHDDSRAYLVRGVAYGPTPAWCRVRVSPAGEEIWVEQATYDGESLFSLALKSARSPVIVFLNDEPKRLYATNFMGGDRVMRRPSTVERRDVNR